MDQYFSKQFAYLLAGSGRQACQIILTSDRTSVVAANHVMSDACLPSVRLREAGRSGRDFGR